MTIIRHMAAGLGLLALAGCGPAFIDRSEPEGVDICYNKATIDPQDLLAMARDECARHGGRARLTEQSLFYCPAFSPVMMTFACDGATAQPEEPRSYSTAQPVGTPGLVNPATGEATRQRQFYVPEQGYSRRP
tara:strand:- start:620 stop:1018 length:399 start_codon:yes stop_codon:yes gene_type:complete